MLALPSMSLSFPRTEGGVYTLTDRARSPGKDGRIEETEPCQMDGRLIGH